MLGTVSRKSRFLRIATAAVLAVGVYAGSGIGQAHADDDDSFEQNLIRQFMRGLGLKDGREEGIDYQERAPLVLPANRDLPPPETAAAIRNPDWPVDPDVTRRANDAKRRAAAARKAGSNSIEESMRPLSPEELAKGKIAARGTPGYGRTEVNPDPGRPLRVEELTGKSDGSTNLFSNLWSKVAPAKDEYATFKGEPDRKSLTAPPAGYRTPSPAQPYGVIVTADPNKSINDSLKDKQGIDPNK